MKTTARTLALVAGAIVSCAPFATAQESQPAAPILTPGQPVTDAQMQRLMERFEQGIADLQASPEGINRENYTALIQDIFGDLELEDLSAQQIGELAENGVLQFAFDPQTLREEMSERMKEDTAAGASMAVLNAAMAIQQYAMFPGQGEQVTEALNGYLEHPKATHALGDSSTMQLFQMISQFMDQSPSLQAGVEGAKGNLVAFARKAVARTDAEGTITLPFLVATLSGAGVDEDTLEPIKKSARDTIEDLMASEGLSQDEVMTLEMAMNEFTREERVANLVGNEMPAMDIIWSSDPDIDSFEDYRGKVLVLDFWATWCGPCIMSFPNVRDLQEKYEDYDVAIVGVTSVQGTHYPVGGQPVDCSGDPEKEMELMAQFMKENDVTWDVVFTEQEVFNQDYAIQGIPHVVIVDTEGNIRHRGLHPTDQTKSQKINAILKEAGKEAPGA